MKRLVRMCMPLAGCLILSGCAGYNARQLEDLTIKARLNKPVEVDGGKIYYEQKFLSKDESVKYLDGDTIKQGYQPIQIAIVNATDNEYQFSINMPIVDIDTVLTRMYDNTWARVGGWGSASLITGLLVGSVSLVLLYWPVFHPVVLVPIIGLALFSIGFGLTALFDGLWSRDANKLMAEDYHVKVLRDKIILDRASVNGIVFIDSKAPFADFRVKLRNVKTGEVIVLPQ